MNSDKVGTLLDILVRRGDKAFDRLIRAIVETDQDVIALTLDKSLAQKYISVRDSCRMEVQHSSEPIGNNKSDFSFSVFLIFCSLINFACYLQFQKLFSSIIRIMHVIWSFFPL